MFKWLIRNVRTLFIALALALAVWLSAVSSADPDEVRVYPRPVPVEIIGQNPGLVLVGPIPDRVNVTLRAPRSVWDELTAEDSQVRAILDLSGLEPGQHQLQLQLQVKIQPVRIITVTPNVFSITLERLATKTYPIELSLRGEPAVGYQAGDTIVQPAQAVLSGPSSQIERIARVVAEVSIAGVRQDVEGAFSLRIVDANGVSVSGLSVSPDSVQVTVPVSQQGGYRDIAVKVNVRGQVAGGYRLTNVSVFPPVLTVFSQKPSLVADLPGIIETEPLNLNGVSEDIDVRLNLVLPEGISIIGDQTVQVQVGISPIVGSLSLNGMPVEVIGLIPGLTAQISPEIVDVILTGPLPLLDKLKPGDVKFIVDLTGLAIGVHQLTPEPQILIGEIEVQSLNPATIEITIQPELTPSPTTTQP